MTPSAPAADGPLTYRQKERILKRVILGSQPRDESPAEEAWRKRCEDDVARCRANGVMPEIPFDPTYDDEDDKPAAQQPKPTGTELATVLTSADAERSVDMEEYKDRVRGVAEEVARELGVTPLEALAEHIDPTVFLPWRPKREKKE